MTLKKILNSRINGITAAAIVIGAAYLASKFLGLYRDRLLAGAFGAGDELDIYYAAFRIPDLIYYLVVLGAVSAGLIPVFVDYLKKEKKQAWYLISNLVNIMSLVLIAICTLMIIFAPWLMKLIVPGFGADKLSQTADLTRIMFLSPILLGLSAIFGGVIQSFRRFFIYAFAPILYNIGIIIGVVFFYPAYGLMGLAWGVVLGAFLHLVAQFFSARACGYKYQFVFDYKFTGVRRIFKVMLPRTMGLALNQLNILLMTIIGSTLAVGSIAVYNLAQNIWSFPLSVFGISFVTASFPKLSEEAQKKDVKNFLKVFISTGLQILFFMIPAAVMFIVLRAQIVRVILGTGKFDWADTIATLDTLAYFCLGLFAEALIWLFLRGFFAWEDAKTPFVLGLISTALRLIGAWFFASYFGMGVPGLALGFSLGGLFYLSLLFIALGKKLRKISKKETTYISQSENMFFITGLKMIVASLAAGVVAFWMLRPLSNLVDMTTGFGILSQGSLAGLCGILVYIFFSWLFKIKELNIFVNALIKRLPWKKIVQEISEVNGK